MERKWLKEALFGGMTANSFKLGTVLTQGWFWSRVGGCAVLYRGQSMDSIDFKNILTAADMDASAISPPAYIEHEKDTTWFYIIRRVNSCGYQEKTMRGAVRVSFNSGGDLREQCPNSVLDVRAGQESGGRVELVWYYETRGQESEPASFKIYTDNGTGVIDYDNPVGKADYTGRGFYRYVSDTLASGRYLFAIRAEDLKGRRDESLSRIKAETGEVGVENAVIMDYGAV